MVGGDDILWTCTRGGIATRLAVRHMSLFELAEAEGHEDANVAVKFWRRQRRTLMERFGKALVEEAVAMAKNDRELPRVPPLAGLAGEAARMFARANALVSNKPNLVVGEGATVLAVISSSLAHGIYVASPVPDDLAAVATNHIASAEPSALAFADQTAFEPPKVSKSTQFLKAAWASRRLDTTTSRAFEIDTHGTKGADAIVDMLSSLSISDADRPKYYYCPIGSRIEAVPSRIPFAIDALGSRLVWLETLERTAMYVSNALRDVADTTSADSVVIQCTSLPNPNVTGLARHPLALTVKGSSVELLLSKAPGVDSVADREAPGSLSDAVQHVRDNPVDVNALRRRIWRTRAIAYNSERLLMAVSLSGMLQSTSPTTCVKLTSETDTVALSIALAMQFIETGSGPAELVVHVPDVDASRALVRGVSEQAKLTRKSGCKVCSLAELALCV